MRLFKKVTIVGVGLLGGSIGMGLKKKKLALKVVGFFRNKDKIARALRAGAIDEGTDNFLRAVKDADLIILCTPVKDIINKLAILKKLNMTSALITDTGSTKSEIVKAAGGLRFIGSHPLAGSEQSGVTHARPDLLKGSLCILTPDGKKSADSIKRIDKFWRRLGAKTLILEPQKHDSLLASASHLPHAIAFSLIDAIPKGAIKFVAGGLKDTTRIALSNPDVWVDIFLTNRKNVLRSIDAFERSLKRLKKSLTRHDKKSLFFFLAKAQRLRRRIPAKS